MELVASQIHFEAPGKDPQARRRPRHPGPAAHDKEGCEAGRASAQQLPQVQSYLSPRRFLVRPEFTAAEVKHFLLPKEGVVDSYVVEEETSDKKKVITDLVSYYSLASTVLKHDTIKEMKATSSSHSPGRLHLLLRAAEGGTEQAVKGGIDICEEDRPRRRELSEHHGQSSSVRGME